MQSSGDGFFYHPQWGADVTPQRRGRDLTWATILISDLGAKPLYDTPNGIKGSLGAPKCTHSEGKSDSKTASSPAHLRTLDAFNEYLDSIFHVQDFNSYSVGNLLNSQAGQIAAAGENYKQFFTNYVAERQNSDTGLWEPLSYRGVNGLMKIGEVITSFGYPIPNSGAALESAMAMALTPTLEGAGNVHVCSIYNYWVSIDFIIRAACRYEGEDVADKMKKTVLDKAPELLRITKNKMLPFKKSDGGFSYTPNKNAERSQGALISPEPYPESGVNATHIMSSGTLGRINGVLDSRELKIYGKEDSKLFLELL